MTRKKGRTAAITTTSVFTFVSFLVFFSFFQCKCYALLVFVPPKPSSQTRQQHPSSFVYSKLQIRRIRRRMKTSRSQQRNETMIANHSTTTTKNNVDDNNIMLFCLEEEEDQDKDEEKEAEEGNSINKLFQVEYLKNKMIASIVVLFTTLMSFSIFFLSLLPSPSFAATTSTSSLPSQQQADPQCFINKCGIETQRVFFTTSIISNIKGLACLGGCPENDQMCSTRCFAKFATPELNQWLTCTIETNKCIQFPPPSTTIENNNENLSLNQIPLLISKAKERSNNPIIRSFQQSTLINNGKTWYKTHGLNPNYDLYSCQSYTFENSNSKIKEDGHDDGTGNSNNKDITLNMAMKFRVVEEGDGDDKRKYWETIKTEPFLLHNIHNDNNNNNNMLIGQISGQFYGLHYNEDWYLIGEATTTTMEDVVAVDDENNNSNNSPTSTSSKVLLIAYKGHTIRGDYYGSFVLTDNEQRLLTKKAELAVVQKLAKDVHLNFLDDYSLVDNNHCPN